VRSGIPGARCPASVTRATTAAGGRGQRREEERGDMDGGGGEKEVRFQAILRDPFYEIDE